MAEENANVDECWIHGEDTLKCNTLFKKIKIVSKHIVDTTFLHRSVSKLCVIMRTFMYFRICKKKDGICFSVSASRYVCYDGPYVRQLDTDGAPIARILTVYQVLQGRRCYPHNINIKYNLLFSEHIKRAKRKGHMRKK